MSKPVSFQQRNTNILKVILAVGFCVMIACWLFDELRGPTPLINGIASHQSPTQVKAQFGDDLEWKTVTDSSLEPGDTRPRFDIYTISAPYIYRSVKGELTLRFFNNQLASTTFRAPGLGDLGESERAHSVGAKIECGGDYISWQDERLNREMTDWIWAYA